MAGQRSSQCSQTRRFRRTLGTALVATFCAALAAACGPGGGATEGFIDSTKSDIIGGVAVSIATRRTVGLVNVTNDNIQGSCSGSLISRDWVITATHCLDFNFPPNNRFEIPRANGTLEKRTAFVLDKVGASDITIVQLGPRDPVSEWPSVGFEMYAGNPAALVGQTISCYGRGATLYAAPSGTTGGGSWRLLIKQVSGFSDGLITTPATDAGTETAAPGDSGAPCYLNGETVGVLSTSDVLCNDHTNDTTCDATITHIFSNHWRSTTEFKTYIDNASSRLGDTATFKPITLQNGWTAHPFSTNAPAFAVVDSVIHLRGAIASGSSPIAFTLPGDLSPSATVYVPTNLCNSTKGRIVIAPSGTVSVGAEGGAFSNAQCFTSLEGVSFTLEGFAASPTPLTLSTGWTSMPFGTRAAGVRVSNGIVRLTGAISGGPTASPFPFTLPAGFRPTGLVYVPVDLCGAAKGRLQISADGTVQIQAFNAITDATCFTSLEGVSFPASGGYTSATLANGWAAALFTAPPGFKNVGGIIRLTGAMSTSGSNTVAFSLPVNMRPATSVYAAVDLNNSQKGRLLIQPDGSVTVQAPSGAFSAAQSFTSLEGAWFGL